MEVIREEDFEKAINEITADEYKRFIATIQIEIEHARRKMEAFHNDYLATDNVESYESYLAEYGCIEGLNKAIEAIEQIQKER